MEVCKGWGEGSLAFALPISICFYFRESSRSEVKPCFHLCVATHMQHPCFVLTVFSGARAAQVQARCQPPIFCFPYRARSSCSWSWSMCTISGVAFPPQPRVRGPLWACTPQPPVSLAAVACAYYSMPFGNYPAWRASASLVFS